MIVFLAKIAAINIVCAISPRSAALLVNIDQSAGDARARVESVVAIFFVQAATGELWVVNGVEEVRALMNA